MSHSQMIQQVLIRILLSPIAAAYGLGVSIRNALYQVGFLKGTRFNVPVISVGNLTMGGAGKTPHVEYLATWLSQYINVSILSRGYKRKTKGFLAVQGHHQVEQVGDEAVQYRRKFPHLGIYVSESRVLGIPKIVADRPDSQTILLDDGFQHRAVSPGLNILLTEFDRPFATDYLLPVGRLREWRRGYQRADIIIVTKCPTNLGENERSRLIELIRPLDHQQVFFTRYRYGRPYHLFYPSMQTSLHPALSILALSGIAKTDYFLRHLEENVAEVKAIEYEDHHYFSKYEVAHLKKEFDAIENQQKIIVTTQKDATRLERHQSYLRSENLPIYVLPAFVSFDRDEHLFNQSIQNFLLQFKI